VTTHTPTRPSNTTPATSTHVPPNARPETRPDTPPDTPSELPTQPRRAWLARFVRAGIVTASITGLLVLGSCIKLPAANPAYDVTAFDFDTDLERMRTNPVGLERPVLVLSGYRSPDTNARDLADSIVELTGADPDLVRFIAYPGASTIEEPARLVVELAEEAFPSDDPERTTEIDVVAISMGGLVARLAAEDPERRGEPEAKRLNIRALYTLATPHRGARMAKYIRPDPAAADMRPGSRFITGINARADYRRYNLVTYAALHDRMVGATRTAPPGLDPIWVPGRLTFTHFLLVYDDALVADLARRLRREEPFGGPSTPPRD